MLKWDALGSVFFIALGAVVVVTGLFALGVRGLSARSTARETGANGSSGLAVALSCFAVCVAVAGYGIYLVVAA